MDFYYWCQTLLYLGSRYVTFGKTVHYTHAALQCHHWLHLQPWIIENPLTSQTLAGTAATRRNTVSHQYVIVFLIFRKRVMSSGYDSHTDSPSNSGSFDSPQGR